MKFTVALVILALCAISVAEAQSFVSGYWFKKDEDLSGSDLKSDGNGFYKVCGSPTTVAAKCNEPHKGGQCQAFVYSASEKCGYLKYATGPTKPRGNFYVYIKGSPPPTPSPQQIGGFYASVDSDIDGYNLGSPYTRVCGDVTLVGSRCTGSCKAFSYNPAERCGYLKTAAGPFSTRVGWYVYQKTGSPSPSPVGCKEFKPLGDTCNPSQGICCGGNKNPCTNGRCVSSYPTSGK